MADDSKQIVEQLTSNRISDSYYPLAQNKLIVSHDFYALSYSEAHEQAEWVAYKIIGDKLNRDISRSNNFREDTLVTSGTSDLIDYKGSGYDRGHLVPAADMRYSLNSMSQSFLMSNISPQLPSFNQYVWRLIEKQFRDWSKDYDSLIIITGPVLNANLFIDTIGENKIPVPRYFYKVAIDPINTKRAIAVLIENMKYEEYDFISHIVTIDSLEEFSGIDFFASFPDSQEVVFESVIALEAWGIDTAQNRAH